MSSSPVVNCSVASSRWRQAPRSFSAWRRCASLCWTTMPRVASDQTSQHFRLILGVDEAQDAVGLLVVFTLLSLSKLTISSTLLHPSAEAIKEATMRSSSAVVVDVSRDLLANVRWLAPLAFLRCPYCSKTGRWRSLHLRRTRTRKRH